MQHARERGAAHIGTSEGDAGALRSAGFTNREGGSDGRTMLYYEREP